MSATGQHLHQHERPGQPAAAPRPVLRDGDQVLATILLVVTLLLALQIAGMATNATGVSAIGAVWLLWPVLAAAIVAMIMLHGNGQRCVDKNTMTVVPATNCQPPARPGTTGRQNSYAWYYLGRGTQTGDRVQGGSFTRPDQDRTSSGDTGGAGGDGSE